MKVLLRVVLTLLLVFVAVEVGFMFGPRLAQFGAGPRALPGSLRAAEAGVAQPDWGGGRVSVTSRPAAVVMDSLRGARKGARVFSGPMGGVALERRPGTEDGGRKNEDRGPGSGDDYAITMVVPVPGRPGRAGVYEVPSSGQFRKELLPGKGDALPPAADIPLYPASRCRMQVGRGTTCFVGFYLTPDSVEAVRSFYVRVLGRLGWQRLGAGRAGAVETFAKRNEDRSVVVQMRRQDWNTTRIGLVATDER